MVLLKPHLIDIKNTKNTKKLFSYNIKKLVIMMFFYNFYRKFCGDEMLKVYCLVGVLVVACNKKN